MMAARAGDMFPETLSEIIEQDNRQRNEAYEREALRREFQFKLEEQKREIQNEIQRHERQRELQEAIENDHKRSCWRNR
jgi:hypothetical protein